MQGTAQNTPSTATGKSDVIAVASQGAEARPARKKRRRKFLFPLPDDILRVRRVVVKATKAVCEVDRLYGHRAWQSDYDPRYNFKESELLRGAVASMRAAQDRLIDLFRLEAAKQEDRSRRRQMERTAAQALHAGQAHQAAVDARRILIFPAGRSAGVN